MGGVFVQVVYPGVPFRAVTVTSPIDDTARRRIEKAIEILSKSRAISEDEAYNRIRDKSQNSKESIVAIGDAIISASDL